jgi:CrcB protein
MNTLLVGVFGVLGVLARYYFGLLFGERDIGVFPSATFLINVIGSFLIGVVYSLSAQGFLTQQNLRLALTVGFLGGFTTFSAFSLDTILLVQKNSFATALLYVFLSVGCGIPAAWLGIAITKYFVRTS